MQLYIPRRNTYILFYIFRYDMWLLYGGYDMLFVDASAVYEGQFMNNVNLQQMLYFKIAMKCSSFSQAAELAYTTQSTISKNISALEKIIGEPFLHGRRREYCRHREPLF
ncbi:MAG: LysR family transcriptional regulator [Enterocloster sp.]